MRNVHIFSCFSYFVLSILVGLCAPLWSQDIFEAVETGNVDRVKKLVKDDPSLVDKTNE